MNGPSSPRPLRKPGAGTSSPSPERTASLPLPTSPRIAILVTKQASTFRATATRCVRAPPEHRVSRNPFLRATPARYRFPPARLRYHRRMDTSAIDAERDTARHAPSAETLGQLVGQMAHDLNNLVATALIGVELAASEPGTPRSRELLAGVMDAIRRQQALALAMGRIAKAVERPLAFDLHALIDSTAAELRAILGSARLELRLDAGDARIVADPRFVRTALCNLVRHAGATRPEGGTVLLQTAVHVVRRGGDERRYVRLGAAGAGHEGTGDGRGFELFAPTPGDPDGLLLTQARDAARRAGGSAALVASAAGGLVVTLDFPLAPRD